MSYNDFSELVQKREKKWQEEEMAFYTVNTESKIVKL